MLTAARFLQTLSLGVWLGAMIFLGFVLAPAAFKVLPTRELAGQLVGLSLTRLYLLSYICAALFLLGLVVEQRLNGTGWGNLALPVACLAVMSLLTLFSHFYLGGQMAALRVEMTVAFGSIDATPKEHILRASFGRLHGVSTLAMMANMLLGLALLFLTVRRFR